MRAALAAVVALSAFAAAMLLALSSTRPARLLPAVHGRLRLPADARVEDGGLRASWGPAGTRCGSAEATLTPTRGLVPEGFVACSLQDLFAGGSAAGDCPSFTVCVARGGALELTCLSPDDSCRAVAQAFARP